MPKCLGLGTAVVLYVGRRRTRPKRPFGQRPISLPTFLRQAPAFKEMLGHDLDVRLLRPGIPGCHLLQPIRKCKMQMGPQRFRHHLVRDLTKEDMRERELAHIG